MNTSSSQYPHGLPCPGASPLLSRTKLSTSEVLLVSSGNSNAPLTTPRFTQLPASKLPNPVAASEHSKSSVPALAELQRLEGNAFSLRQVPVPCPSAAGRSTTDSAGNTVSLNHATSSQEAGAAVTAVSTSTSWTRSGRLLRAGWASLTPPTLTAMTVPHPATVSTPCAWRDTAGGSCQSNQAAPPSDTERGGGNSGVLMRRFSAPLQLKGRSGFISARAYPSQSTPYEDHPSDAQNGFPTTHIMPFGSPIGMSAEFTSRSQLAPHTFYGDLRHDHRARVTKLKPHSSQTGSVVPKTPRQRNGGTSDWQESASQESLPALALRDKATVSGMRPPGLSSLPLSLPLPHRKSPSPRLHRVTDASEMHTRAHVAAESVRMKGQVSLPTPADALCNLFQQYIEAQRVLQRDARQQQLDGASGKPAIPLDIQEMVLRRVQDFVLQLDAADYPHVPSCRRASSVSSDHTLGAWTGKCDSWGGAGPSPLLPAPALHKGNNIPWDTIFDYLADPPTAAYATLRAVAPASRRRLEQLGWRWMIEKVSMSVCPFIRENDTGGFVRDAYARLDGQERQYIGSVPVARCMPLLPPNRPTLTKSERLLDGGARLNCEQQSLLLDWAWREGWLHRLTCSYYGFLLPCLSDRRAEPPRICVDGVFRDVLRPKRNRLSGSDEDKGGFGALIVSEGAWDMRTNAAYGARLTPPPVPILEGRSTEALSATRKLLDDAVSAISREWARSAGVPRLKHSHSTLAPFSQPSDANSPSSTVTGVMDGSLTKPPQEEERRYSLDPATDLPHHPHYSHASVPVLVEDVSGTVHLLCTSKTQLGTTEVWEWVSAWLQHRHRLPHQLISTSGAEFLLVQSPSARLRALDDEVSKANYTVCTTAGTGTPSLPADIGGTGRGDRTTPRAEDGAAPNPPLFSDSMTLQKGGLEEDEEDGSIAAMPELAFTPDRWKDHSHMVNAEGLAGVVAVGESRHGGCRAAAEYHTRMRLQDCSNKEYKVVRSMDDVDPPRLMLGNTSGCQLRPLALHLTEQHIPWLAHQLCLDSGSGALLDLQELHLFVKESLLPPGWAAAWRWCMSVLLGRKNLRVLNVAVHPWAPVTTSVTVSDTHGDCKSCDTSEVSGVLGTFAVNAAMLTAPLQVLSLQGVGAEAVAPLFRDVKRGAPNEVNGDGTPPILERLRELYVSVRNGQSAGGSRYYVGLDDLHVTEAVYPALQVLWLDAPRLRHIHLDYLLVLRELHLISETPLACSALRGVERLPHLEVLHLEKALLDDCSFLGDCPALRELLLHACRLSLFLPSSAIEPDGSGRRVEELRGVERALRLEVLSLCYTEEVRNLQNLARCHSLRRIILTRCNGITSSSVAGLEVLPHLELLAMEYTRVSDLSQFACTPSLRVLRVDGCKRVLHSSVMGLENAAHLTELSLKNTNVSTVANLGGGCHSLRSLDLSGCLHLDVDGLQGIQALPQLEVLSLSHMPITDVNYLADCVRLTALYLEGCTELLPTSLEGLQRAPRLRKLVANGCPTLTRVGCLGKCASLEVFAVAGATALTVEGLQGIEQGLHIEYLDLSFTAVHTLQFLVSGCRALRYLSVKGCRRITDMRALHGMEELPQLQTLNMESLDVHGSLDFLARSTSLHWVSCAGCTGLSSDDVQALRRAGVQTAIP